MLSVVALRPGIHDCLLNCSEFRELTLTRLEIQVLTDSAQELEVVVNLKDLLRWFHGGDKKEKSVFASEKEAYDFLRNAYKSSGGIAPELRKAYEFYKKNAIDECQHDSLQ